MKVSQKTFCNVLYVTGIASSLCLHSVDALAIHISGSVADSAGKPVAGAIVSLTDKKGKTESAYSDAAGAYVLDADLDGWQDLIVTNGHVGNLKHHGVPYEMPPQFYRNLGKGTFVELPASTLGSR